MPAGTRVYLNPETLEIAWGPMLSRLANTPVSGQERPAAGSPKSADAKSEVVTESQGHPQPVSLGKILQKGETVSHLLSRNPLYKKDIWRIIHSELNHTKPYTKILPGTEVYIDPQTLELTWNRDKMPVEPSPRAERKEQIDLRNQLAGADQFSEELVRAVEPYVGRPYEEMDCFQLVVQGLEKMGVRYQGRGGLGERLMEMATGKGLPSNAYLNGEGLIEASGSKVYSKSMFKVQDSRSQAREIYKEMEPFLRKGFILSFSTPTRGHTGIVSQKKQVWTYINSGEMDHHIGARPAQKSVGEESLIDEVRNWLSLAAERGESLIITLGRLQANKLPGFGI
jgi:hypothetical protein